MGSSGKGVGSVVVDNHLVFLVGPLVGFPAALERQTGAMWPTLLHLWHVALRNLHTLLSWFPRPHRPQGLFCLAGVSTASTEFEGWLPFNSFDLIVAASMP